MSQPVISVVLPVYNGGAYLRESVESVLAQKFKSFELLICDDDSSDGSRAYLSSLQDSRVRVLRNAQNRGLFPTLNRLLAESCAPLIHLWSQDDRMRPECLAATVEFHTRMPGLAMSYCAVDYLDGAGLETPNLQYDSTPERITPSLYAAISFFHGCMPGNIANVTLVQASLARAGLFDEHLKVSGDYEMWTRLCKDADLGFDNRRLICLRNHRGQLSRRPQSVVDALRENQPIHRTLESRLATENQDLARKWRHWGLEVRHFNQVLALLSLGHVRLAWQGFRLLQTDANPMMVLARWSAIRVLRVLGRDAMFYVQLRRVAA